MSIIVVGNIFEIILTYKILEQSKEKNCRLIAVNAEWREVSIGFYLIIYYQIQQPVVCKGIGLICAV